MEGRAPVLAAGVAAALMCAFFLADGAAQQATYHVLSAASALTVVCGVRLHRPAHRTPWLLLASGIALMTTADVCADLLRAGVAVPSAAGPVLYLVAWLLLIQAIRGLARARVPGGDRDAMLDAVAVVVAVALVLWGVLLDPALRERGLAAVPSASIAVFPLAQAGLLALYLRLLFAGAGRLWSAWVLCLGGGLCGLLGSSAYVLLTATGGYHPGAWNNALWMVAYAAPAVAALCPDMTELTRPVRLASPLSTPRWLVLAAALIATTATACFSATHVSDLQLFAVAIPVPLLVLWRLRRVLTDKDAAVARAEQEASRHALVADIGQRAIAHDDGVDLVADACARLGAVLGAPVAVVDEQPTPDGDGGPSRVLAVAVGADHEPRRWLRAQAPAGRSWTSSDVALAHSIANILTTASDRYHFHERLRWTAGHDQLTGLANRRELMSQLHHRVDDHDAGPISLIFLDLNRFKQINDTFGHAAGDAVLVEVSRRLERTVRRSDLVARLAGDEFVVLCSPPRVVGGEDPELVADRIRRALAEPVPYAGERLRTTASVGVAVHRPGQSADELLRCADDRMYRDKSRCAAGAVPAQGRSPDGS